MNSRDAEIENKPESSVNRILTEAPRSCGENQWLLWQLVDSGFPTGGFAHSAGLEAAWQQGEVKNRRELVSFAETSLHQAGRAALPFTVAAHRNPERLAELDELCEAFTTNHVANRASRAQGKAFLTAVQRIFSVRQVSGLAPTETFSHIEGKMETGGMPVLRHHHFACVFGGSLRLLKIPEETVVRLFFFNHLRGLMAAAVRLNVVGPMEAQKLQYQLSATAEDVSINGASLTLDDIAQTSPLLDLWQGGQDRLYSRLFQS